MGKNIKLISDFVDYYDHWFDNDGIQFRRVSTEGLNRTEMLQYLSSKSLIVPPFGIVKSMKNHALINDEDFVVVYIDLHSHKGENKLLLRYRQAFEEYPNNLMTLYVSSYKGVSWRYLKIGDLSFILRYESEDWRSNWNTDQIVIESQKSLPINIPEPLYAIDFVKQTKTNGEFVMVAIDYNIAPQVRGTGIEELHAPKVICDEIRKKYNYLHAKNR